YGLLQSRCRRPPPSLGLRLQARGRQTERRLFRFVVRHVTRLTERNQILRHVVLRILVDVMHREIPVVGISDLLSARRASIPIQFANQRSETLPQRSNIRSVAAPRVV